MLVAAGGLAATVVLLASGGTTARPQPVAEKYLSDWSRQDFTAMADLADSPPPDFAAVHRQVVAGLEVVSSGYQLTTVRQHGSTAEAAFSARLALRGLGTWRTGGTLHLRRRAGRWRVEWTSATINPALGPGDHFVRDRSWPVRAPVLGAGGAVLGGATSVVGVGLEGSRVKVPAPVTAALSRAGASTSVIAAALRAAAAHPDEYVPVIDLSEGRYQQLDPILRPVPGIIFRRHASQAAITPDLAVHIVGSVGPITAEELAGLGEPYEASDVAGQGGIEGLYERRLAGTPGGDVKVVDASGRVVATVFTLAARPGTAVQTTIDPHVEQAAEAALDGVSRPAALVAVRASTGALLAAVSRPLSAPFDRALEGRYPPGSTFKVITAADLLAGGVTPDSPATCPPTLTVDGRVFHNFEGEAALNLPLHRAFAESCNTAFIGEAAKLSPQSIVTTAGQFGFGVPPMVGLPAFGGQVPLPGDAVDKAATVIGQAGVEASPLQMADVAAAVDSGFSRAPQLVTGLAGGGAPPTALNPGVASALRALMAEVVTSGTGTAADLPGSPPVYGKTGTAEFGSASPPMTHAWFIGFRGDVAFAVIVEGGGVGGTVAAPIAARFLKGL